MNIIIYFHLVKKVLKRLCELHFLSLAIGGHYTKLHFFNYQCNQNQFIIYLVARFPHRTLVTIWLVILKM